MTPDLALESVALVADWHRTGHTCHNSKWYNPAAKAHAICPVLAQLTTTEQQIKALAEQTHAAAHNDTHVAAVAEGMTGLVMDHLHPDDRAGWMQTARYAIEALAESLNPDRAVP